MKVLKIWMLLRQFNQSAYIFQNKKTFSYSNWEFLCSHLGVYKGNAGGPKNKISTYLTPIPPWLLFQLPGAGAQSRAVPTLLIEINIDDIYYRS